MTDNDVGHRLNAVEGELGNIRTDVAVIGVTVSSIEKNLSAESAARIKAEEREAARIKDAETRRKDNITWAIRAFILPLITGIGVALAVVLLSNGGINK